MSASQLLRILQSLPAGVDDEICEFNTDEMEASMKRRSMCTNPFLCEEENRKCNFWNNPELESSVFEKDFSHNQEDETFRKSTTSVFDKTSGFYFDKNLVEYELPELMVCYQESDFQVKNMCIDEGLPNEETRACNFIKDGDDDMIEANLDHNFLNHEWLRPSYITDSQEKMNLSTNLNDDESSSKYADDVARQALQGSEGGKVLNESERDENVAFHFDPCGYGAADSDSIDEHDQDTQSCVHHERRNLGESSFSMAGVITELISSSKPITFSSRIYVSNRSDSNATSTRSFAFPTLETEYNSSPVRMGKAERRRLRKQRGWGHGLGLLCCKFQLKS